MPNRTAGPCKDRATIANQCPASRSVDVHQSEIPEVTPRRGAEILQGRTPGHDNSTENIRHCRTSKVRSRSGLHVRLGETAGHTKQHQDMNIAHLATAELNDRSLPGRLDDSGYIKSDGSRRRHRPDSTHTNATAHVIYRNVELKNQLATPAVSGLNEARPK